MIQARSMPRPIKWVVAVARTDREEGFMFAWEVTAHLKEDAEAQIRKLLDESVIVAFPERAHERGT